MLRVASGVASEANAKEIEKAEQALNMHHGSRGQHQRGAVQTYADAARRNMWSCHNCWTYNKLGRLSCAKCGRRPPEHVTKPAVAAGNGGGKGQGREAREERKSGAYAAQQDRERRAGEQRARDKETIAQQKTEMADLKKQLAAAKSDATASEAEKIEVADNEGAAHSAEQEGAPIYILERLARDTEKAYGTDSEEFT